MTASGNTSPSPDARRAAILARYEILDTPREPEFDEIAALVSAICETPIAVVNFLDADRQFFKAEVGLGVRATPFESSFCAEALLEDDFLLVPDTTKDPRFECNTLVTGDPHLRFYAGALLKSPEGVPLGTLCVLDYEPRQLDTRQRRALKVLARHVTSLLELRRTVKRLDEEISSQQRLLETVSHDLRTPISTVALVAALLEKNAAPADAAARLQRASGSMKRLVDDLLEFRKLDNQSLSMDIATLSVAEILDETFRQFEPIADAAGIRIEIQEPTVGGDVVGDPQRIQQALTNLVSNAIKHAGAETIQIGAEPAGKDRLALFVRDDGSGIEDDDVDHMFQPYWRGDEQTEGSGLGLSIVKRLIELQNGEVSYRPSVTGGARFDIVLPIANRG